MAKYEPLTSFLKDQDRDSIPLSFNDIERVINSPLPPSARKHRPWWSNNPSNSTITNAWLKAGYKTEQVDISGECLVFRRVPRPNGKTLHGALAGTISVTVKVDLTAPTGVEWAAEQTT